MKAITKGTLVMEPVDSQIMHPRLVGHFENTLTGNPKTNFGMTGKRLSQMFQKYPPPATG